MLFEDAIHRYRKLLTERGTHAALIQPAEKQPRKSDYLVICGKIVDAKLVSAPKQRNTADNKTAIKAGKSVRQIWQGIPNEAHQKDGEMRWAIKIGCKARYCSDGTPQQQIAMPSSVYKLHIGLARRFGSTRKDKETSAPQRSVRRNLRSVLGIEQMLQSQKFGGGNKHVLYFSRTMTDCSS